MTEYPETCIREAFRSLDIPFHGYRLIEYSPKIFGNLVCLVDTGIGRLRIIYDRQFEIEVLDHEQGSDDEETISALVDALDAAKRRCGF